MLKIGSNTIKKVYLQNNLVNYLTDNFKFVLFLKQFDGGINEMNKLKSNSLNVNTKYLNIVLKNLQVSLDSDKNRFSSVKNLFLNKGILMVKFSSLFELHYFLKNNDLVKKENIFLLGSIINSVYWNSSDLKMLSDLSNVGELSNLKFNLYYKSFSVLLSFINLLNKINN